MGTLVEGLHPQSAILERRRICMHCAEAPLAAKVMQRTVRRDRMQCTAVLKGGTMQRQLDVSQDSSWPVHSMQSPAATCSRCWDRSSGM